MGDLISIIVPMYNSEKTIESTLDSIRNQTFKDYEVILIDDGSKDDTAAICNKYVEEDKRFIYYYIDHLGVSAARNIGIDKASGKFISFVDSDDVLSDIFLEEMFNIANEYPNQIISCMHKSISNAKKFFYDSKEDDDISIVRLDADFSHEDHWEAGVVWGKFIPMHMLKRVRFKEDYFVSEDTLFFMELLIQEKKYILSRKKLYGYVVSDFSAIHGKYDTKKHSQIKAMSNCVDLVEKYSKRDSIYLRRNLCERCRINSMSMDFNIEKDLWDELIICFRRNVKIIFKYDISLIGFWDYFFFAFPKTFHMLGLIKRNYV